jgi:small basic protein (TIGR04137 family)
MSIHPSLRGADTLKGERSVLTRVERIQKLKKEGRFSDDQVSVYGLPKVRTKFKVAGAKKKKKEEGEGAEAAAKPAAKTDAKAGAKAGAKKG